MTVEVSAGTDERSRMMFSKVRQVITQKFGYGIVENRAFNVPLTTMSASDLKQIIGNGALYHIVRIYR